MLRFGYELCQHKPTHLMTGLHPRAPNAWRRRNNLVQKEGISLRSSNADAKAVCHKSSVRIYNVLMED